MTNTPGIENQTFVINPALVNGSSEGPLVASPSGGKANNAASVDILAHEVTHLG